MLSFLIGRPGKRAPALLPPELTIETSGGPVAVAVRNSPRARRLALRHDPGRDRIELVVPPGAGAALVQRFAEDHADWIAARLTALPPRIAFAPGAIIPLLGLDIRLTTAEGRAAAPRIDGDRLVLTGQPEHFARRVTDYLKQRARAELRPRAEAYARRLGRRVGRLRIGDMRSRWGSCSPHGDLSFSWRLILTPEPVLDYVAAHEAAHLVEMNHGPEFWNHVAELRPDYLRWRTWLRAEGLRLLRYG